MKVQHLVTSLLILLLPLCLSAQGDAITSGEALIKRTVADTKAEQLVPSMTWWVTLGMVDSIKATTFANFFNPLCDPYPKTIVSTNPGALIAYDQLNIFTYLQDLASINRYLSYGVSPSSDTPTTDLRLDISSSEAVRNKEKETPSANPTWSQTSRVSKKEEVDKKAKLESEKALEMRRQSEASRITQATSNAVYPFVRTYLYMENGLLKNPQYIRLPKNKKKELKVLDTRYEAQSRTYRRLVQMYTTTVLNPE